MNVQAPWNLATIKVSRIIKNEIPTNEEYTKKLASLSQP